MFEIIDNKHYLYVTPRYPVNSKIALNALLH